MGRGMLTDEIKKRSSELLGYEITVRELRLMPYIDYTMKNNQYIEMNKINDEEHEILHKWQDKNFIIGTLTNIQISKEFYTAMQEILWIAYVAYEK